MIKQLTRTAASMALVIGMGSTLAMGAGVASASSSRNNISDYAARLSPLNDSGVTGRAQLSFEGTELQVNLHAKGLVPNMPHPAHIHGSLTGVDAQCPTGLADVNNDGFVSVVEGAPAYGSIKLNLTTPQTPFGAPPNALLFAPFAGTPSLANFPVSNRKGKISVDQTYKFDMSKSADRQAYAQLRTLNNQHIVVHGGYAPESVDTAGGSSKVVYDALLPVACGQIHVVYKNDHSARVHMNMNKYNDQHGDSDHNHEHDSDHHNE